MTKLVRPFVRASIAAWMVRSVRVSTFEVASSRMSMGASSIMARAMVTSCFCPPEREFSPMTVSAPCGSAATR